MESVPAGSYLVISHPASDLQAVAMAGMATRLNQLMAQRVTPRSREKVTAWFDGLELIEPGVIRCPQWHRRASGGRGRQVDDVGRGRSQAVAA
jgi:S-adenosyl methyltransferase